jgi:hypothetical protein
LTHIPPRDATRFHQGPHYVTTKPQAVATVRRREQLLKSNYEFLCEFAHPNSFGAFNFYAKEHEKKFVMSEDGFSIDIMQHVLLTISIAGVILCSYKSFLEVVKKIEEIEENSL